MEWLAFGVRVVKPETIIAGIRRGIPDFTGPGRVERAMVVRPNKSRGSRSDTKAELANPRWGAPRIHGELLKLGIDIGETTVAQIHDSSTPAVIANVENIPEEHMREIVSTDFFVVPTATFRLLFAFLILSHDRRRIAHFAVTAIQRLNGRHNNSSPRSLGTHHLDIYCVNRDGSMADRFRKLLKRCRFRKFLQLHARLGRMLLSRDSWFHPTRLSRPCAGLQ